MIIYFIFAYPANCLAGYWPWYVSGPVCTKYQEVFNTTLNHYSVDLIISGHVHVFALCPDFQQRRRP